MTAAPSPATIDTVLVAVHEVGAAVGALELKVDTLSDSHDELVRRVDGSNPPAPLANGAEPLATKAERGSKASFDVEELKGELMAVRSELAKQSKAMGLDLGSGLAWLVSKDGRSMVIRLATLAGAAYAALHSAGVVR